MTRPALQWSSFQLPNGLRVILQPDEMQHEVAVEFWVHAGTRDERQGQFGLAHFCEHVTPYGLTCDTASLQSFRHLRTNSNAQTKKDYTKYYIQVKPEGLSLALQYTAERILFAQNSIPDSMIEIHRRIALDEMSRQERNYLFNPTASACREASCFGAAHPYGHGVYGSRAENENFTAHDVASWFRDHFFANHIILVVVGKFNNRKAKAMIQKWFTGIPSSSYSNKATGHKAKPVNQKQRVSVGTDLNSFSLTWPTAAYGSADDGVLQLLAFVMDDHLQKQKPLLMKEASCSSLYHAYEKGSKS